MYGRNGRRQDRLHRREGAGRPHALSDEDHKALRKIIKKNPTAIAATLKDELKEKTGKRVSERTIQQERHELDLHPVHAKKRPLLTPGNIEKRYDFALANLHTDWKYVVFDDESPFTSTITGEMYWIPKGEPRPYEFVSQSKYHCSVWAGFWWNGKFPCHCYIHSLTADSYQQILAANLVPHYPIRTTNRLYYLAHDNATSHMARSTIDFLDHNNIRTLLDWPPNSPELNPVEKAWGWMKNYMKDKRPRSQQELQDAIEEAWDAMPQQTIQHWILHCKSVCKQLVDSHGDTISE